MATYSTLSALFTAIANAIRAKKGTSASIVANDFPTEIASISGASDFSQCTISSNTVLAGYKSYNNQGTLITGDIATHSDSGLVALESGESETKEYAAGYYPNSHGAKTSTETKEITAAEAAQTVYPSEHKLISRVDVSGVGSDYVGSEIPRKSSEDASVSSYDATNERWVFSAPAGYYASAISKILSAVKRTALTVSGLTVTAPAGYYPNNVVAAAQATPERSSTDVTLASMTRGASLVVPYGWYGSPVSKTLTDSNIQAANIKSGVTIFGVTGTYAGATRLSYSSRSANLVASTAGGTYTVYVPGMSASKNYRFYLSIPYTNFRTEDTDYKRYVMAVTGVTNGIVESHTVQRASSSGSGLTKGYIYCGRAIGDGTAAGGTVAYALNNYLQIVFPYETVKSSYYIPISLTDVSISVEEVA